jgi:hypothetical protein
MLNWELDKAFLIRKGNIIQYYKLTVLITACSLHEHTVIYAKFYK